MLTTRPLTRSLDRVLTVSRALDEVFMPPHIVSRAWMPAMDVAELPDAYAIALEIPGVDPASVEIGFEKNVLTIRGSKAAPQPAGESYRLFAAERTSGTFERAVRLPEFVDGDRISAEATHGVLRITVPKAEAAKPRRISIVQGTAAPSQIEGDARPTA